MLQKLCHYNKITITTSYWNKSSNPINSSNSNKFKSISCYLRRGNCLSRYKNTLTGWTKYKCSHHHNHLKLVVIRIKHTAIMACLLWSHWFNNILLYWMWTIIIITVSNKKYKWRLYWRGISINTSRRYLIVSGCC